jgi:hypothetical protein
MEEHDTERAGRRVVAVVLRPADSRSRMATGYAMRYCDRLAASLAAEADAAQNK